MNSAWHRPGLFFLVVVVCLATCIGCAEPSDNPSEAAAEAAETPAMIFFTPTSEGADSVVEQQAPATGSKTAAESPSPDSGTPAMIFFTATANPADATQSPASAGAPGVATQSGAGAPGVATQSSAGAPGVATTGGGRAAAAQFTRVALELTPSSTVVARPSRAGAAPSGTAELQGATAPDEGPSSSWPKGGAVAAGLLVAVTVALLAWYFFRRRG